MFIMPSVAHFHGTVLENLHSFKECTFPRPDGAAGGAGCGQLRDVPITFSPRASHALIFLFCLLVAAQQVQQQLRGSRTPHSSVRSGCSLLHGYRQLCAAIRSVSAEPSMHWLSK